MHVPCDTKGSFLMGRLGKRGSKMADHPASPLQDGGLPASFTAASTAPSGNWNFPPRNFPIGSRPSRASPTPCPPYLTLYGRKPVPCLNPIKGPRQLPPSPTSPTDSVSLSPSPSPPPSSFESWNLARRCLQ